MIIVELIGLRKNILTRAFVSIIPFILQSFVLLFLLPQIGISKEYTLLVMVSRFFTTDSMGAMAGLLSGLGDSGALKFLATMPVPVWLVFTGYVLGYTARTLVFTLPLIPIAAVLLFGTITLSVGLLIKFLFTILVIRFFDSVLGTIAAGWTKGVWDFSTVFARIIGPMSFIAMYSPKWPMILSAYPRMAWVMLLNPLVYLHEMGRAVVLGSKGFVPYYVCFLVLTCLSTVLLYVANMRLQRRFDLI